MIIQLKQQLIVIPNHPTRVCLSSAKENIIQSESLCRVDLPLGLVGLVCASVVCIIASVVSLSVVETVLKETKQLVKQRVLIEPQSLTNEIFFHTL